MSGLGVTAAEFKKEKNIFPIPLVKPALSNVPSITWAELKIGKLIGNGSYGDVYQGQWQGIEVAIKQLQLKTLSS